MSSNDDRALAELARRIEAGRARAGIVGSPVGSVVSFPTAAVSTVGTHRAPPAGVSQLEALTYVPGLVGELIEWIVASAPKPSRVLALGAAVTLVGTIIGRRV